MDLKFILETLLLLKQCDILVCQNQSCLYLIIPMAINNIPIKNRGFFSSNVIGWDISCLSKWAQTGYIMFVPTAGANAIYKLIYIYIYIYI